MVAGESFCLEGVRYQLGSKGTLVGNGKAKQFVLCSRPLPTVKSVDARLFTILSIVDLLVHSRSPICLSLCGLQLPITISIQVQGGFLSLLGGAP